MLKFIVAFLLSTNALADTVEGDVKFEAVSTSGLVKINGTGGKVTGDPSKSLEVELAPFDTGNNLRNEHMRDKYLEVGKFPKATLKLDAVTAAPEFNWTGLLTIKGETKPVKGKAKLEGDKLWAEFTISLEAFPAIGVPSWLGVTVAKDVTVTVIGKVKP
jgi:hypothetical protein